MISKIFKISKFNKLSNVKNLAEATDQISHRFLIIRAGDVETNPGPVIYEQYTPKPLKDDGDNICFGNSIIQLLCIVPEFTNVVIDSPLKNKFDQNLKKLFSACFSNNFFSIKTKNACKY